MCSSHLMSIDDFVFADDPESQSDTYTTSLLGPSVQVSARVRSSALVFCFSDGWNQAARGFILTDLVDGERIHRLDLYGPQVGALWLICKPCLFCRRGKIIETKRRDIRQLMLHGSQLQCHCFSSAHRT